MRIDNASSGEMNTDKLKKELTKELKPSMGGKLFGCGGCCLFSILILATLVFGGGWFLARTGLVYIPKWTERYYEKPNPGRRVVTERDAEAVKKGLEKKLQDALRKNVGPEDVGKTVQFPLYLSEEELTVMIREGMKQSGDESSEAQIAITKDFMELYAPFKTDARADGVAILRFVPEVKDGTLALTFVAFEVGQVRLPAALGRTLLSALGKSIIREMEKSLNEFGTLKAVNLNEGELYLELEVKIQGIE